MLASELKFSFAEILNIMLHYMTNLSMPKASRQRLHHGAMAEVAAH